MNLTVIKKQSYSGTCKVRCGRADVDIPPQAPSIWLLFISILYFNLDRISLVLLRAQFCRKYPNNYKEMFDFLESK